MSPGMLWRQLIRGPMEIEGRVFLNIRLPRVIFALLAGSTLAAAGAALQGLFRNVLVDPGLIGISSGAAFSVSLAIVLNLSAIFIRPGAAFIGGVGAAFAIYTIGMKGKLVVVGLVIMAGLAVNAMLGAATGFLTFLATNDQLRDITFWTLGSLGGIQWIHIMISAPLLMISLGVILSLSRQLNGLYLGEREAVHLGIPVERIKKIILIFSVLGVSTLVAFSGVIGFIGLIGPHISRKLVGMDNRVLLPSCALIGGGLLLFSDSTARIIIAPSEVPLGIITACIGGPFFLILILRRQGGRL